MGFTYLKCHDLLPYSIVMRHLGYLQFGINPENAALNILVHVLHILGLYPRVNFLLDIIFECLLLSRNYESRLGTGIKSWKSPVPACKDLKTPWRTEVGWQILLAVCKDHGWYGLGLNEQTRERRGKQGQEKLLSKMTLKLGFERWGIDWVPSGEACGKAEASEKAGQVQWQCLEQSSQVRSLRWQWLGKSGAYRGGPG